MTYFASQLIWHNTIIHCMQNHHRYVYAFNAAIIPDNKTYSFQQQHDLHQIKDKITITIQNSSADTVARAMNIKNTNAIFWSSVVPNSVHWFKKMAQMILNNTHTHTSTMCAETEHSNFDKERSVKTVFTSDRWQTEDR